jgi:ribonuclease Z
VVNCGGVFRRRLVNPIHLDPALLLTLPQSSEQWLFDCGDLHGLALADLQRISTIFLSHGHIDHWIGLDQVLRAQLYNSQTLRVMGPAGTLDMLGGRLRGYAWNLVAGSPFRVEGYELSPRGWVGQAFPCARGFEAEGAVRPAYPDLGGWRLQWVELEHGVPCLGYRVESPPTYRFLRERAEGLVPGPWVEELKQSRIGMDAERRIGLGDRWQRAGNLWHLLEAVPLHEVAYVTDTRLSEEVRQRIVSAFGRTAELWCEAAFLEEQRELAEGKKHATAREAASLAAELRCERLYLFHLSRRTQGEPEAHLREAREVFASTEAGSAV